MKFSVTYPLIAHPYSPDLLKRDALRQFCQTAERSGFDGIGFTDHPAPTAKWLHSGGHDALDPFVALSFCAAMTERIRLIPNIVVLPYRHPLIVAKMVATLHTLSEGRFTLAVATGYLRGEYKALGVDFEQRNALFDQSVEVIRGVWSDDDFTYEGAGIAATGLAVNPKPSPPPPLWIGGNSSRSRRRVARYGDGWTPFPAPRVISQTTKTAPLETIEDLAEMLDELWRFVDEVGRDRAEIDVAFGTPEGGTPGSEAFQPEAHLRGLQKLVGLGVTWAHTSVPGDSLAHALETLQRYGETVISPSRA
ncbi:MAG TPA: TIGR03619 family F420-dependent LLM class oxidoreductase [Acidimicrobiales bacterium]|nr:TIGR03619 family F420-dependent LLM class oxidoreductase [Acidimicrobiales bacterium]